MTLQAKAMFWRVALLLVKALKDLKEKAKQLQFSSSCAFLKRIADPADRFFVVRIRLDFKLVKFFHSSVYCQKIISYNYRMVRVGRDL